MNSSLRKRRTDVGAIVTLKTKFVMGCKACTYRRAMSVAEIRMQTIYRCLDCPKKACIYHDTKKKFILKCPQCKQMSLIFCTQKHIADHAMHKRSTKPTPNDISKMKEALFLLGK